MAFHLSIVSLFTTLQVIMGYTDILPMLPENIRSTLVLPEDGLVRFYSVTKRGGPIETPVLPWQPRKTSANKKFYFNIESAERGLIYRVKLKKNQNLFSRKVSQNLQNQDMNCLFSGTIVGEEQSTVGMNLCTGMASILSRKDGEFLLEPSSKDELHRHEWQLTMKKAPKETLKVSEKGEAVAEVLDRVKRSVRSTSRTSLKRNIEILVVADNVMVKKYGTEEATTYILTVMNMVSSLFKDKSLAVDINIVMAGLMFLKGNETGFTIGHRADETLNNFCKWQASLKDEIHHDHALLMTGVDICVDSDSPCDTIGYAPIRGMCSSTRSCTVNEDRGLGVAFTIAHEIGHNLGMVHDGAPNNCTREGSIMGSSLATDTGTFFWSKCNQRQLDSFLASPQANCLLEEAPVKSEMYNMSIQDLPGQVYNADQQCKHIYGDHASTCQFQLSNNQEADICRYLWCYVGGMRCETKFLPAAEGTPCDDNKWCRQGECIPVDKETPEPIDGGWDEWSDWTECTRTCGGGVQTRLRLCTSPSPKYGGRYCAGENKEFDRCNMEECEDGEKAFRELQCRQYNDEPFRGRYFKWFPVDNRYLSAVDKCQLFCRPERYKFYFQMNDRVIDGTRCDYDRDDICINGKCQPVGCDGRLWSDAKEDKCGVCNGDDSTCETIRGMFTGHVTPQNYTSFLTIPVGSKNIQIKEMRSSSSFIAIKSHRKYYLNGDWSMNWPGDFSFAGSKFTYNRLYSGLETVYSPGPTNESLEVQLLAVGTNPGVQYEYTVPIDPNQVRYSWKSEASKCSEECGGGFEELSAFCVSSNEEVADDSRCLAERKPLVGRFKCNVQACPARWVPQQWSSCSRECDGGKQRRDIYCMQKTDKDGDKRVKNKYCRGKRPPKTRRCNLRPCQPQWSEGTWSECSTTCGAGMQRRAVYCMSRSQRSSVISDSECDAESKPAVYKSCNVRDCAVDWYITAWSQCSASCGLGTQSRQVVCVDREPGASTNTVVDSQLCEHIARPSIPLLQNCQLTSCPSWQTGVWSQCSATCGESERRRKVVCALPDGTLVNSCDYNDKPPEIQACHQQVCPTTPPLLSTTEIDGWTTKMTETTVRTTEPTTQSCVDRKSWCPSLSVYKYYCMRSYYRGVCCHTCSQV